ncbi:MAG: lamin tail domain-containing protein, partial [Desulfobacterales bacterium]|nr:lamin tail domain-containing protein [Desulfobacterales bacterium]
SMAALVTNRVADLAEPVVTQVLPFGGQTVAKLLEIELFFSEQVTNVDAGDLLINGVPATNVTPVTWSQYVFRFPQPPTGQVQVAWATNHGITDLSLHQNAFAGGSWTYNLDPNATLAPLWITEFLAANRSGYPNAIRDEDGEYSDWIEIFNSGTTLANLGGWFLTDDPANLTKWEFPAASLAGNRYLVVFTSGKDRRPVNGQLHANFNLAREGAYLALVSPATNVVMQYSPTYPPQNTGVSYGMVSGTTNTFGFFVAPTPGAANSSAGAGFAPAVKFSRASGTFAANFSLILSTDDPAAEIRYVLGTNTPTASSTLYTGPITVSGTVMVRARAYRSGLLPGPLRSEAYLKLDATVLNRTSDLPIVVLHD